VTLGFFTFTGVGLASVDAAAGGAVTVVFDDDDVPSALLSRLRFFFSPSPLVAPLVSEGFVDDDDDDASVLTFFSFFTFFVGTSSLVGVAVAVVVLSVFFDFFFDLAASLPVDDAIASMGSSVCDRDGATVTGTGVGVDVVSAEVFLGFLDFDFFSVFATVASTTDDDVDDASALVVFFFFGVVVTAAAAGVGVGLECLAALRTTEAVVNASTRDTAPARSPIAR
jgi:hypothetical protein